MQRNDKVELNSIRIYPDLATIYSLTNFKCLVFANIVSMKATYEHIDFRFEDSFHIQRFDQLEPCDHSGLHLHQGYEIVYVKNGKGIIKVEGKEEHYNDGTLIFIGPSIPHFGFSNTMYDDNFEVVIHLDENFVKNRIGVFPEFSGIVKLIENSKKVLVFDNEVKNNLSGLFQGLTRLATTEQLISIFDLLYKLSKVNNAKTLLGSNLGEHYAQSKQIKKVFEYINDNFHQQISTQDIADEVGLTTNSFCRMFKKLTGISFISYLKDYRIHRAAMLLEETEDSIAEVMYKCGFDNPSYFAKVFVQIKDIQPMEYRRRSQAALLKK